MHSATIYIAGTKITISTARHDIFEHLKYYYEFFLVPAVYSHELSINDETMARYQKLAGGDDPLWSAWNTYLVSEIQERLSDRSLFLHGCCITTHAGGCSAFLGRTMSGKTTLFLTAIENGFGVLSDDIVIIDCETDTVYPFIKPVIIRKWLRNYVSSFLPSLSGRLRPFVIPGTDTIIPGEGAYLDVKHVAPHASSPTRLGSLNFLANEPDTELRRKLGEIIATPGADHSRLLPALLKLFNKYSVRELTAPTLFNYNEQQLFAKISELLC